MLDHSSSLRSSRFALSLVVVVVATLGLSACHKAPPAAPAMPPPEVSVITVQAQDHPVSFEYTGQTAGSRETEVRARVSGVILKRLYEEGSTVAAGAPLFQIDPAPFQTRASAADAAVALAQAKANQAQRDYERLKSLIAEKAVSQKDFDDSKSNLELAQATLKQAQAQASEAQLNLGYTKVTAPISGVTGAAAKSDGNLVGGTDTLLTTIVQTNPMYINFSVPEADYLRMTQQVSSGQLNVPGKRAANGSLGFAAQVKLADGSLFPLTGKLNFASERVNPQTSNLDVRAEIANPQSRLRPGQFVRVILSGANRPNTLSVPQRAVIDGPMGKMLFVVTPDNKLAPRPVKLDGWSNGQWIVADGLKSGERVLVEGFIKANTPGMTVKPVPYVATPSASASAPAAAGKAAH